MSRILGLEAFRLAEHLLAIHFLDLSKVRNLLRKYSHLLGIVRDNPCNGFGFGTIKVLLFAKLLE